MTRARIKTADWTALITAEDHPFLGPGDDGPHPVQGARHILETFGLSGTERVCLVAEDKRVMAAAVLAAASGGPGLLVPYATSPRVVASACKDAGVTRVLTDGPREIPGQLEVTQIGWDDLPRRRGDALRPVAPDQPFLWLYTGGSTGTPKVWTKTPRNLLGEATLLARVFDVGLEDHVVGTIPVQHIYGLLFSVVLPLVSGATATNSTPFYPQAINDVLAAEGATILVSSPAHYKAMGASPPESDRLRLAFSSGSFLAPEHAAPFEATTGVGISEVYGSTETGGVATRTRRRGEVAWSPLDEVDWRIRDERLLVRSLFLSPELERTEEGFYRTGDRATDTGDGRFLLLGRADGIVKVGGKRVVLDKVREALISLEGIRDAVVLALPADPRRGTNVGALYEGEMEAMELRRRATQVLEAHELPRLVRRIDNIPRSALGKLDQEQALAMLLKAP